MYKKENRDREKKENKKITTKQSKWIKEKNRMREKVVNKTINGK